MLFKGARLRSTCFFFRLIHIIASQLQVKKKTVAHENIRTNDGTSLHEIKCLYDKTKGSVCVLHVFYWIDRSAEHIIYFVHQKIRKTLVGKRSFRLVDERVR